MPIPTPPGRTWLIAAAAPAEARAILRGTRCPETDAPDSTPMWSPVQAGDRVQLILTGVGKANAAGAVAHALDPERHAGVLSLGICGSLPGSDLSPSDVVIATHSVYADEGLITPAGFMDLAAMGFPPGPGNSVSIENGVMVADLLRGHPSLRIVRGPIATVSTCSGTDDHAAHVSARTGALAEAMEGAALAFTVARLAPGLPFCEARVVSNTTGNRSTQQWDLQTALTTLTTIAQAL